MKCPVCGRIYCYHTWSQMASAMRKEQKQRDEQNKKLAEARKERAS